MKSVFIIIVSTLLNLACHHQTEMSSANKNEDPKQEVYQTDSFIHLYNQARINLKHAKYDSAITYVEKSFQAGFDKPMSIIQDYDFYSLIDLPNYRAQIRELLKLYSRQSSANMVRTEEEGELIIVQGLIIDESTNQPIENVAIELVQADQNGHYFEEQSLFNPRIFAYLRTNDNGEFNIKTIRPGSYLDDNGQLVPSHIHFTLSHNAYRMYASEFTFDDDPVFKANGNIDRVPVAQLSQDTIISYNIIIGLQTIE